VTESERLRFEVLLEEIKTGVNVIGEGHEALTQRLDRIEGKVDKLEDRLESFATDTNRRLDRIEGHLGLNGSPKPRSRSTARKKK
jgi:hypothetical protein